MDGLEKSAGIISAILGIISFFIPNIDLMCKIIIILSIISIYLLFLAVSFHIKAKSKDKDFMEVSKKHKALSRQFDKMLEQNSKYKITIDQLTFLGISLSASTQKQKLERLTEAICTAQVNLSKGDMNNE